MRSAPIAATLCFLGLASALSGTPSGATSGVALPAPTVRLGVGNVQVSWTRPSSAPSGAIYTLSRETATATRPQPVAGCSGPDLLQCTVPSMDQNSWQYTVSVASPKTATAAAYQAGPSPLSAAYKVRIILVVAGQSNALGARSLASDPSLASTTATSPADANDTLVYPRLSAHATTDQTLLSGPLWATEQSIGMVGPELGLARKIYVDTKTKVTIVKVACGGTSLVDYTNTPEATAPCFNGPTQYDGTWDPAHQDRDQYDADGRDVHDKPTTRRHRWHLLVSRRVRRKPQCRAGRLPNSPGTPHREDVCRSTDQQHQEVHRRQGIVKSVPLVPRPSDRGGRCSARRR